MSEYVAIRWKITFFLCSVKSAGDRWKPELMRDWSAAHERSAWHARMEFYSFRYVRRNGEFFRLPAIKDNAICIKPEHTIAHPHTLINQHLLSLSICLFSLTYLGAGFLITPLCSSAPEMFFTDNCVYVYPSTFNYNSIDLIAIISLFFSIYLFYLRKKMRIP